MSKDVILRLRKELRAFGNKKKANKSSWFFKTGVGQYGYGDMFIGVTVPEQRKIAKKFRDLSLSDIKTLLKSEIHEERLTALLILVDQFEKGSSTLRREIFNFYVSNTEYVNNWDLVDSSADKIVGGYLLTHPKEKILSKFAHSQNMWERRIAIIATFQFLKEAKNNQLTFQIAKLLLSDRNDLIQKAVGWMLRESGKKVSEPDLKSFLNQYSRDMGRTALRYSIERLSNEDKKKYMLKML
jgi:3-methyladenine DNA glycosylase AlkD